MKEELRETCNRFGTVIDMKVVDHDDGEASVFASFGTKQMAEACANNLAGRRFYALCTIMIIRCKNTQRKIRYVHGVIIYHFI